MLVKQGKKPTGKIEEIGEVKKEDSEMKQANKNNPINWKKPGTDIKDANKTR